MSVVGILGDEVDPMVSVMKVDKAPLESYADIGMLEKCLEIVHGKLHCRVDYVYVLLGSVSSMMFHLKKNLNHYISRTGCLDGGMLRCSATQII